jgi:predicted transcriptional regulator
MTTAGLLVAAFLLNCDCEKDERRRVHALVSLPRSDLSVVWKDSFPRRVLKLATNWFLESKCLLERAKPHPSRKSPVQIRFEVLEYLFYNAGPHSRTSLWRHATQLSYDDFQKYLEYLKQKGFVEEWEGEIRLANYGKEVYVKLRETLPSIL